MLDFTNLPTSNKLYPGGSGAKRAVIYQGEQYLLKFPATSSKNKNSGHSTSYAAEYIGCHIFNSVGIRAQDTILGIYRKNGEEKVVVACKDFTSPGVVLQDFASLQNSVIDYGHSCYSTELPDIMQAMEAQTAFPPAFLKRHFWDMFIVDALIGNGNRNNENWGFLYNTATDAITIAPCTAAAAVCIRKRMKRPCGTFWKIIGNGSFEYLRPRFPESKSMVSKSTILILSFR